MIRFWYYANCKIGGMGPVTRGVCVLQELVRAEPGSRGVLVCDGAFRWVAEQEGLQWFGFGSWRDWPETDQVLFDYQVPATARTVLQMRCPRHLVLSGNNPRDRSRLLLMDQVFTTHAHQDLGDVAEVVGPIYAHHDPGRGRDWWAAAAPRVLVVPTTWGGPDEALALDHLMSRQRLPYRVLSPWLEGGRYWPVDDLFAGADLIVLGGLDRRWVGWQTWQGRQRERAARFGVPVVEVGALAGRQDLGRQIEAALTQRQMQGALDLGLEEAPAPSGALAIARRIVGR